MILLVNEWQLHEWTQVPPRLQKPLDLDLRATWYQLAHGIAAALNLPTRDMPPSVASLMVSLVDPLDEALRERRYLEDRGAKIAQRAAGHLAVCDAHDALTYLGWGDVRLGRDTTVDKLPGALRGVLAVRLASRITRTLTQWNDRGLFAAPRKRPARR